MIVINSPKGLEKAAEWKERLESMTVPHQVIFTDISEPRLSEGKRHVQGEVVIENFLEVYEKDMAQWNQDRCDMWFFDE